MKWVNYFQFAVLIMLTITLGCTPMNEREQSRAVETLAPSPHYEVDTAPLSFSDWEAFADRIKEMGRIVDGAAESKNELDRAEGYRYLLGVLQSSIEEGLYQSDLEDPNLRYHITKYMGEAMPSSDARYQRVDIDGRGTYRFWGTLGNAAHITLQAYSGLGAREMFGIESLVDAEGRFELVIGPDRERAEVAGVENYKFVSPDTEMVQLREYFGDWERAERSHFFVERLDQDDRGVATDGARIKRALIRAALPMHTRVPFWKQLMDGIKARPHNTLAPARIMGDVGMGGLYYGDGWFDLAKDEALVIELEPPEARHWSFQLGNYWSQWLDWANFTSSINGSQAKASADGIYRLVVARVDPGVPNWLDTAEHAEGVIVYRYHEPDTVPLPTIRLVKLAELRNILPPETPVVGPEARAKEIALRRAHKRKRWQP